MEIFIALVLGCVVAFLFAILVELAKIRYEITNLNFTVHEFYMYIWNRS